MSNGNTERKVRSVTTTFTLKDVAVIAIAAFTAAGPFFAYDTRISVMEAKVAQQEAADHEMKAVERDLESRFDDHLASYEETRRELKKYIEEQTRQAQQDRPK